MQKAFLDQIALVDPPLADLLDSMLEFNPLFRKTASELLQHEYFDDVRVEENEVRSDLKLELDIDTDEFFNSKTSRFTLTSQELVARLDCILENYEENHPQNI